MLFHVAEFLPDPSSSVARTDTFFVHETRPMAWSRIKENLREWHVCFLVCTRPHVSKSIIESDLVSRKPFTLLARYARDVFLLLVNLYRSGYKQAPRDRFTPRNIEIVFRVFQLCARYKFHERSVTSSHKRSSRIGSHSSNSHSSCNIYRPLLLHYLWSA